MAQSIVLSLAWQIPSPYLSHIALCQSLVEKVEKSWQETLEKSLVEKAEGQERLEKSLVEKAEGQERTQKEKQCAAFEVFLQHHHLSLWFALAP